MSEELYASHNGEALELAEALARCPFLNSLGEAALAEIKDELEAMRVPKEEADPTTPETAPATMRPETEKTSAPEPTQRTAKVTVLAIQESAESILPVVHQPEPRHGDSPPIELHVKEIATRESTLPLRVLPEESVATSTIDANHHQRILTESEHALQSHENLVDDAVEPTTHDETPQTLRSVSYRKNYNHPADHVATKHELPTPIHHAESAFGEPVPAVTEINYMDSPREEVTAANETLASEFGITPETSVSTEPLTPESSLDELLRNPFVELFEQRDAADALDSPLPQIRATTELSSVELAPILTLQSSIEVALDSLESEDIATVRTHYVKVQLALTEFDSIPSETGSESIDSTEVTLGELTTSEEKLIKLEQQCEALLSSLHIEPSETHVRHMIQLLAQPDIRSVIQHLQDPLGEDTYDPETDLVDLVSDDDLAAHILHDEATYLSSLGRRILSLNGFAHAQWRPFEFAA